MFWLIKWPLKCCWIWVDQFPLLMSGTVGCVCACSTCTSPTRWCCSRASARRTRRSSASSMRTTATATCASSATTRRCSFGRTAIRSTCAQIEIASLLLIHYWLHTVVSVSPVGSSPITVRIMLQYIYSMAYALESIVNYIFLYINFITLWYEYEYLLFEKGPSPCGLFTLLLGANRTHAPRSKTSLRWTVLLYSCFKSACVCVYDNISLHYTYTYCIVHSSTAASS